MTEAQMQRIAAQVAKDLVPVFKGLERKVLAEIERRFDGERAATRALLVSEVEPIRARERQLSDKLAAIAALVPNARKTG